MYFWMLFAFLALCKELWSFPRKTQCGLLEITNLIEVEQSSFQHSHTLCRPCVSHSHVLDVRVLQAELLRAPSGKGIVDWWGLCYSPHIIPLEAQESCPPGHCSSVPAVAQVAVLAVTVGLLCLLLRVLVFSWPTYLIFTAH